MQCGKLEFTRKLPQVRVSSIAQKLFESDHAFGNASGFRGCLDFGASALLSAVVIASVAREVWRVRKLLPVMVIGWRKNFVDWTNGVKM